MTKAEKESLPCGGLRPGGEEKERVLTTQLDLRGHALQWQEAQGNKNTFLAANGGKSTWDATRISWILIHGGAGGWRHNFLRVKISRVGEALRRLSSTHPGGKGAKPVWPQSELEQDTKAPQPAFCL